MIAPTVPSRLLASAPMGRVDGVRARERTRRLPAARGTLVISGLAVAIALTLASIVASPLVARRAAERRTRTRAVARALGATDLVLTTEARYTRHPSQADLMGPFGDHPGAREHFPSGALILPRFTDE